MPETDADQDAAGVFDDRISVSNSWSTPAFGMTSKERGSDSTVTVAGRGDDFATGDDSLEARGERLGIAVLKEVPKEVDRAVLASISKASAEKYGMAAYDRSDGVLRVATSDPENIEAMNVLRFLSEKEGVGVEVTLAPKSVISKLLEQYSTTDDVLQDAISSLREESGVSLVGGAELDAEMEGRTKREQEVLQDAPIARLVESIIKHAIEARASDIHIEPTQEDYRVRFRVDGLLHSSLVFPLAIGKAVVARVKILSNMKIDEKRKPQDGRFRAKHAGESVDVRVSTFPVVDGEKVVMRILEKNKDLVDFKEMGLWGRAGELLLRKIREPYGIILMTGPTGSGKSTTLYSFLRTLNQDQRNIVTLEDPVEYSITGVNQSQVNPEIGYTFASGLRSILRQDPNVIMVGEIRDGETAELAIHSALTGHLVLSTLHTNNAIGSIPRLVDMGIEPFLIASSLHTVAAQRLVRRICPKCKTEITVTPKMQATIEESIAGIAPEELKRYGYDASKGIHLYRGKGCEHCGNSGYKGRIAIYEAFEVNEEAKRIITDDGANEPNLHVEAKRQRMLFMRQDGLLKALQGITTITEVERVTEGDIMVDEE
jgi:type IV pilus assembly protein PilB